MKLKLILFFLLFGVKAVLSACPADVNFGQNTGGNSFHVFLYENGTFDQNQIESISKSDVESEFLFLLQTFLVKHFSSRNRNNPNW